jgi:NADPH:quinone reductase-like Zn-dependent oxidoreductase
MRAMVYDRYGPPDVLRLEDIDAPVVGDDDVLVRIRAAAANPYDWHFMRGEPYLARLLSGLRKPKRVMVLGSDMAGEVEAVGRNVTAFHPGDEVFGCVGTGGFAELIARSERTLVAKPANVTFEQAAAVPLAGLTALKGLRDYGRIQSGQRVLINGASGGVGTFAVQIAKSFDAEVTGVCSGRNAQLVRDIGADHVVDYTREDVTRAERRYDVVLDNVGNHSLTQWRSVVSPQGTFVSVAGLQPMTRWLGPLTTRFKIAMAPSFGRQRTVLVPTKVERKTLQVMFEKDDLQLLKGLIEDGKVTPVVDRTYPLEAAPDAIRYLEDGHVRGKVVVTV